MDDFKDLMWTDPKASAPPIKPKPAPQYDSFSLIAASQSQSRATPNYLSSTSLPPSRSLTPSNGMKNPVPSKGSDAFSGLLSLGASNGANMSLAERQAKAEQDRLEKERKQKEHLQSQSAFWDTFEGSGSSSSKLGVPPGLTKTSGANGRRSTPTFTTEAPINPTKLVSPPSMLRPTSVAPMRTGSAASGSSAKPVRPDVSSSSSASAQPKKPAPTVWDFDLLGASSSTSNQSEAAPPSAHDDLLGEFDLLSSKPAARSPKPPPREPSPHVQRSSTPGDFDWGDEQDGRTGLLNNGDAESDDGNDILGTLSKPFKPAGRSAHVASSNDRPPPVQKHVSAAKKRSASPPPHVLGRLVEMGFSIQQARTALATTDSGVDVEAAMDFLLAQSAADPAEEGGAELQGSGSVDDGSTQREREEAERRRRHQERRRGPSRANAPPSSRESESERPRARTTRDTDDEPPAADTLGQLSNQADKVLAQASEIGLNLFSKANTLWKTANKVYEEKTKVKDAPPAANGASGRPKWMVDDHAEEVSPVDERQPTKKGSSRRDACRDHDDEEQQGNGADVLPPRPTTSKAPQPLEDGPQTQRPQRQPPGKLSQDTLGASLFDSTPAASTSYISPHRRKAVAGRAASKLLASPAPPLRKSARAYVTCPPSTLADATARRTAGSAAYKLGQYADAEVEFSAAIQELPSNHMALIPLWNNRAMTRLKTGDASGAVGDCASVLDLIGEDWAHGDDERDAGGPDGPGVALGEAAVKALTRRAMAYEAGEKWEKARDDWERLLGVGDRWGPAGGRAKAEAARGLERCRKILNPPPAAPSASRLAVNPGKPRKKATSPIPVTPSGEASARLQAANAAAEAADDERYRVKDSVDQRLIAWKGGKENNIRALIASLENVLWPELGWVKVGMAELITEAQVKIRYMKAIAKLHPDKLRNATVEHQMIANGVFGALNDAYNVFKP